MEIAYKYLGYRADGVVILNGFSLLTGSPVKASVLLPMSSE